MPFTVPFTVRGARRRGADLAVGWTDVGERPVRSLTAGAARDDVLEVVVVPGLGALGYLLPAVRAAAAWTRVTLLDVPGFGSRRTARCPAALEDVSRTVAQWLEAQGPSPVLLVGHSTGGQAALGAALLAPDHVATLVLAGVTFPPDLRRWGPLAAAVVRGLPYEHPGELPAVLPDYVRGARRLPELLRSCLADDPRTSIGRLSCPMVVLRGAHDPLCPPEWARQLVELASEGRDRVVPGGHNAPFTFPVDVAAALEEAARAATLRGMEER